jgi:IS66 Orf2 like protein
MIHWTSGWPNGRRRAPPAARSGERLLLETGRTRSPHKLRRQPSMPAILVRARAQPRCTKPGVRAVHAARRLGPARHEAGAKDIPRQQIAIGMLNDVGLADRVKLLFWDGTGVVLVSKTLEQGHFRWPKITDGVMRLTSAQLAALLEGLDWTRVRAVRIAAPKAAG